MPIMCYLRSIEEFYIVINSRKILYAVVINLLIKLSYNFSSM